MKTAKDYKLTTVSCFIGIINQAVITNLTAVLFVPMMSLYGLSYIHLGILVGINFTTQVAVDFLLTALIDRIPFRKLILPACLFSFFGLVLFAFSPLLFDSVFTGMVIATVIFSAAAGMSEVLLSPIVNAIPFRHKGTAMSLFHSFYAWGQVATIAITSLFLFIFGVGSWPFVVLGWAMVPFADFILFFRSPFPESAPEAQRKKWKELLKKPFFIFLLIAIFSGAGTELVMSQFSSSFMEKAMLLPKLTGDMVGVAGFAFMLGVGRLIFARKAHSVSIHTALIFTSAMAVVCYVTVALSPFIWLTVTACIATGLAASMLWPGTLIIAGDHYPLAGSLIFALLAASGDIGAAFGPWMTSLIIENSLSRNLIGFFKDFYRITTEQAAIRIGILFAALFPLIAFFIHLLLKAEKRKEMSCSSLENTVISKEIFTK